LGTDSALRYFNLSNLEEEQMATVVDARAHVRSGLIIAVAVVLGLIALVAVNFSRNPPHSDSQYSAPVTPP
jgi:hypothetical protein